MKENKEAFSPEERAEFKLLTANIKTIIYYYQELNKKLKEQNEKLEKIDEKLKVILRK